MTLLKIYYHRDFDGMASAAILAKALVESKLEKEVLWQGVNFDNRLNWDSFASGERFAIVDFHFHPRAEYWFDHHPTTFLQEGQAKRFENSSVASFDPESPSCPPIILRHAKEHWNWQGGDSFQELAHWSNVIDSASFKSAEEVLFGQEPALQISRSLTCAPDYSYHDRLVGQMRDQTLLEISLDPLVSKCAKRAERNRDNALENFPPNVVDRTPTAILADLRSKKIRRERFSPFYLYPELEYAITILPTRAGVHITAASNPWNRPSGGPHLGHLMEKYEGGGHQGVGGCNPPDETLAVQWAQEIFEVVSGLA
ncbi:MAG TPA: hypothetical protein QGG59_06270 [Planctomycetota bacterium]|jgi:hypothetical protein|nr:hypothetical protein [Planctomycetota bacterium]MDP6129464.1 hypothetical protein [Planctomycetota bacterium]MDP7559498.1 hypothetical protein [Planctomycetota bacterium]HJM39703.1 hypothetical protein [Planctomycetota bacterium]|tara:strand:- start:24776 stop:25714 length:939 start_codon:yes stop_codon:yes gene_type:complete